MEILWTKNDFSVGNDDLDAQHKQLFALTNEFISLAATPPNPRRQESLYSIVKQLVAYTRYHFSSEEAVFQQYGFPQSAEHKAHHEAFTAQITGAFATAQENEQLAIDSMSRLLLGWLDHHIKGEDRAYAEYFKAKGIVVDIHFSGETRAPGAETAVREGARRLWTEKQLGLELGNVDHQHQELVLILQQASDLLRANEERRKTYLPLILEKLYHYSQYHFLYEEDLMSRNGFTELPSHQEQHHHFIEKILDFSHKATVQKNAVNEEIVVFLKHWIVEHILIEDKKFKLEFQKAFPGKKLV